MVNGEYRTSDTPLAVYLYAEGFKLIDIDYSQPRYEFVFRNDNSKIQEAVRLFTIGKAHVEPATYARLYGLLKKTITLRQPWTEGVNNG